MPKLSVIVPVYGVEKYIERCARSLFEQTLDDIEYIFVDDCTPDCSIEILERIIEEYRPRFVGERKSVRIVRMPTNSGLPAVRRHGIQLCTGDYVIHCDSDDWVDVNMYKALYDKAIEGNYDMVRCNFVRTDGVNERLCPQIPSGCYDCPFKLIAKAMSGAGLTSTWDKMFKRTLYHNDITFPTNNMQEDAALVIQLLYYCKKCAFVPMVGYYYFINNQSISKTPNEQAFVKRLVQVCANGRLIYSFLEKKGAAKQFKNEIIAHKLMARNHILYLVRKSKYYRIWRNTFPEIDKHIYSNPAIHLSNKIWYFLTYTKLFGLAMNICSMMKKIR